MYIYIYIYISKCRVYLLLSGVRRTAGSMLCAPKTFDKTVAFWQQHTKSRISLIRANN